MFSSQKSWWRRQMWSVPRICWSLHHLSCSSSWSQAMNFVIPWALILILLPIHHRYEATPSFETFTSPLYLSSLEQLSSFLAYLCKWYFDDIDIASAQRSATPDPSFGHLCCTLQVYHLDFFTNLCLHLCSSMFYHAAAYCKEMQKHTCHFPAIEQRNYARAWPLPGVTECSNKGDKNFLSMKISPKAEKHSFWRPFFQAHFTTNYSNFYLSSHSKGQNLEMCNIWIFYNQKGKNGNHKERSKRECLKRSCQKT